MFIHVRRLGDVYFRTRFIWTQFVGARSKRYTWMKKRKNDNERVKERNDNQYKELCISAEISE